MNEDFEPGNSYRVTLDEDGDLIWRGEGPDGPEVWSHEPGASVWKRALARMISWLPIENEL